MTRLDSMDKRWVLTANLLAMVAAGTAFVGTLSSTSAARIAALRTVEPYALAAHQQLVTNFSTRGRWFQTIHAGYDDAWTWSGHRALTLFTTAWLYALHPSALWLTQIQIITIALGAIPAALIGRSVLRSDWGLSLGAGLYLLHPAINAIALQDYQDLCLAIPALTFTLWTLRARSAWWPLIGAAVGVMPREECVPLVVACALFTWPDQGHRRYLRNQGSALLIAGLYVGLAQWLSPMSMAPGPTQGHDTPLVNALQTVLQARSLDDLVGMAHVHSFYSLLWSPVGALALLAPASLAPAVALILMHMTVPYGNGVDRYWAGHAHHLAPVMPFMVVATTVGAARLLRALANLRLRGRAIGRVAASVGGIALLGWCGWWLLAWGTGFHLIWSWLPQTPRQHHPAWDLVERLPPDAVPVVSVQQAVLAGGFSRSFTWEESLHDKAAGQGLGAATHLIAPRKLDEITSWALSMPGAQVVDQQGSGSGTYLTIAWPAGGVDTAGKRRSDSWPALPSWVPDGATLDTTPGVPPPPPRARQ